MCVPVPRPLCSGLNVRFPVWGIHFQFQLRSMNVEIKGFSGGCEYVVLTKHGFRNHNNIYFYCSFFANSN